MIRKDAGQVLEKYVVSALAAGESDILIKQERLDCHQIQSTVESYDTSVPKKSHDNCMLHQLNSQMEELISTVGELCRFCCKKLPETSFNIFLDELPLLEMIRLYLHFPISLEDELPKRICVTCYNTISEIHKFVQSVSEVQSKLLSLISQNPPEPSETTAQSVQEVELSNHNKREPLRPEKDQNVEDVRKSNDGCDCNAKHCSHNKTSILFECVGCNRRFETDEALKSHTKILSGKRPYQCCVCRYDFIKYHHLQRHLVTHQIASSYTCNICSKVLKKIRSYKKHQMLHDLESLRPFECDFCKSRFKEKGVLASHLRIHTGERPYLCKYCGKGFAYKSGIVSHTRMHTGDKPFKCTTCAMSFRSVSSLAAHTRSHTGEKPYQCQICGKKLAGRTVFIHHMHRHTGEKPHECKECGQRFIERRSLVQHTLLHSGERPFQCSVCQKGFRNKQNMTSHTRIHTGEKPFKCSTCGSTFTQAHSLKYHLRTRACFRKRENPQKKPKE